MVENRNSIADGLAVAKVGTNSFNIAAPLIDKMVNILLQFIRLQFEKQPEHIITLNSL